MIAKAEKKIEYLGELKQSLITRAVTRGLNPNASLKDSGVKWIGKVPEHWETIKLSRVYSYIGSGTTPLSSQEDYYSEEGYNWLQTGDLNNGLITQTSKKITKKAIDECRMKFYPKHSVVIAMYGATIGKVGLLDLESTTNQACCVISPTQKMNPLFTFYSFMAAKKELLLASFGGGQPNISQDIIKKLRVPVPPLEEQNAIILSLKKECDTIDHIIATQKKKIAYLQELKQSLITNVVTGKIKVS
ncbi:restriction endonuclease subunit S [Phocaeicola dorei]|uniref:Restriction endonuclease subunit S n=2 Tax=Bacteroidaceae TaxID=815 RepID=A0A4V2WZD2_9BACT|nr:restriction endonuclease subunit S [Phocaeicola dorei]TDA82801.1 restriction endonuclease subunit S [Phocaeicola dorei]TDB00217.1 restriction endonuclease subunit S [Phocaeicola dorei]